MCYSGKCIWEQSSGDCGFTNNPEIREKYPHPICEIYDDNEEDRIKTQEAIEDIKNMLKNINHGKNREPGFYWVRKNNQDHWEINEWRGYFWTYGWTDDWFVEIDENRLIHK